MYIFDKYISKSFNEYIIFSFAFIIISTASFDVGPPLCPSYTSLLHSSSCSFVHFFTFIVISQLSLGALLSGIQFSDVVTFVPPTPIIHVKEKEEQ